MDKNVLTLAEAILIGLDNISDRLLVYPKRIQNRLQEELPFTITETVLGPVLVRYFHDYEDIRLPYANIDHYASCSFRGLQTRVSTSHLPYWLMLSLLGHTKKSESCRTKLPVLLKTMRVVPLLILHSVAN